MAGRLLALEGARGPDLDKAARRLAKLLEHHKLLPSLSRWDASNTFFELRLAKPRRLALPPRALLLLYASDLLFRLRWEIRPALDAGRLVVAAPYVQTAVGFGLAAGLPREWLDELFRFAPAPDAGLRPKEKKAEKNKPPKSAAGFVEFACAALANLSPGWNPAELAAGVLEHLRALEQNGQVARFGKKLPKSVAKRWKEVR